MCQDTDIVGRPLCENGRSRFYKEKHDPTLTNGAGRRRPTGGAMCIKARFYRDNKTKQLVCQSQDSASWYCIRGKFNAW